MCILLPCQFWAAHKSFTESSQLIYNKHATDYKLVVTDANDLKERLLEGEKAVNFIILFQNSFVL